MRASVSSFAQLGEKAGQHRSFVGLLAAIVGIIVGGAAVLFNLMIQGWTWVTTGW